MFPSVQKVANTARIRVVARWPGSNSAAWETERSKRVVGGANSSHMSIGLRWSMAGDINPQVTISIPFERRCIDLLGWPIGSRILSDVDVSSESKGFSIRERRSTPNYWGIDNWAWDSMTESIPLVLRWFLSNKPQQGDELELFRSVNQISRTCLPDNSDSSLGSREYRDPIL